MNDRIAKMKFSQWLDIYNLNDSAWELCPCFPWKRTPRADVVIVFSYFDFIRYAWWYSKREKKKKTQKMDENLMLILDAAQEDMDKLAATLERKNKEN